MKLSNKKKRYLYYSLWLLSYLIFLIVPLIVLALKSQLLFSYFWLQNFDIFFYSVLWVQLTTFVIWISLFKYFKKKADTYLLQDERQKEKLIPFVKLKWKKLFFIWTLLVVWFSLISTWLQQLGVSLWIVWDSQPTVMIFYSLGLPLSILLVWFLWILEEKIFREILQGELERKIKWKYLNYIIPVLISSSIFALLHNQWMYNLIIFVLGVILWTIYYVFKNIKLNMFIHASNNILWVIFLFIFTASPFQLDKIWSYYQDQIWVLSKLNYSIGVSKWVKNSSNLLYASWFSKFLDEKTVNKERLSIMKQMLDSAIKEKDTFTEGDWKTYKQALGLYNRYIVIVK